MKYLNFLIITTLVFFLTACGNSSEPSQIDNENPVMQAQEQSVAVKTTNQETVTEVDNMKTANQPTEAAAEEMESKEKVTSSDANQPANNKRVKTTTKSTTDKKVMPPAKMEKPRPMTTDVEQKVKVMANEAETQTKENVTTTSTSPMPTATPPRPTNEESEMDSDDEDQTDNENSKQNTTATTTAPPNHDLWNSILQKNVSSNGKVDYAGIKAQKTQLEKYLSSLENNPPQSAWSRNEKLAYWINVYNAYTVKLIVDNYPTKSIMDLAGGKPFDKKWIKIDGNTYSLNNIENDIIRPRFNEPRIHFAVNCAAQSCPPIINKAWTADNLNRMLEQRANSFINNEKFNEISANSVTVSKIFDWYGKDFNNLISYLNKYSDTKINSDATVNYKEYDWSLNN